MNVIIYARVSPKGRRAGGVSGEAAAAQSMESQLEIIRRYCDQHEYVIRGEYGDEFMSGDDESRPGLWEAIEACKKGYLLVVWRYERLARSVFLEESIRRELGRAGAKVEAVDGHNGSTPEDDLVRGILAYVAQYEKRLTSKRTSIHMRARQRAGQLMSRIAPMGTKIDPDDPQRLVPNDDELRQMKIMLELRAMGFSYQDISLRMNHLEEGFRGGRFEKSAIRRGLRRWVAGQLPVPPADPPTIPADLRVEPPRESPS